MKYHILIICILGNPNYLNEGGYHRTVYEIMEYFKDSDVTITIVTTSTDINNDLFHQISSNITLYEILIDKNWVINQDILYLNSDFLLDKIKFILNTVKHPITTLHSFHWINGYLAVLLNQKLHLQHIHSIISLSSERQASGFSLRSTYQRECEDIIFKNADLLIAVAPSEYTQLVKEYNVNPSKVLMIGRDVDPCYSQFFLNNKRSLSLQDRRSYSQFPPN